MSWIKKADEENPIKPVELEMPGDDGDSEPNPYYRKIDELMKDAAKKNQYRDGDNSVFAELADALRWGAAESEELAHHTHEWSSMESSGPTYCKICGISGDI